MKTFSDVITLLSGGEESNLLTRFLSSRPTLKKVLDQSWQEKENQQKLELLKGNYQQVIQQYCRNNELSDVQKDNTLMLLNDVLTKSELTSVGSVVGEQTYLNMRKHVKDKGYEIKWSNVNESKLATLKSNLKSFIDSNLKLDSNTMAAKRACLKLVSERRNTKYVSNWANACGVCVGTFNKCKR